MGYKKPPELSAPTRSVPCGRKLQRHIADGRLSLAVTDTPVHLCFCELVCIALQVVLLGEL